MQTLNHALLKKDVDIKLKKEGTSLDQLLEEKKVEANKSKYSIHKDPAIAGVEAIGRRPKHHLIASVLWLMDFTYRKQTRRSHCFLGSRSYKSHARQVEREYDEILDILKTSIYANYGDDEVNAALDVIDLKDGGFETEFEKHMLEKTERETH